MDTRQLLQAAELVGELAENYYALPEGDNAQQAAVALAVARLFMLRYARELEAGKPAYDALKASAEEIPLAERERKLLHLIAPKPAG